LKRDMQATACLASMMAVRAQLSLSKGLLQRLRQHQRRRYLALGVPALLVMLQVLVAWAPVRSPTGVDSMRYAFATSGEIAALSRRRQFHTQARGEDGSAAASMPSDEDFAMLQQRINEARQRPELPVIVLDAMLPVQRLKFASQDPQLEHLAEAGEIVILGAWQSRPLQRGVIADISKLGSGNWEFRAKTHVEVVGPAREDAAGITLAKVELIEDEIREADMETAATFRLLVEEWCRLVREKGFERFKGQVDGILDDLGPMPPPQDPGKLSMWVAALVNPLPALGVAYEIRPAALLAESVADRLQVAKKGIRQSIGHVSGENQLF